MGSAARAATRWQCEPRKRSCGLRKKKTHFLQLWGFRSHFLQMPSPLASVSRGCSVALLSNLIAHQPPPACLPPVLLRDVHWTRLTKGFGTDVGKPAGFSQQNPHVGCRTEVMRVSGNLVHPMNTMATCWCPGFPMSPTLCPSQRSLGRKPPDPRLPMVRNMPGKLLAACDTWRAVCSVLVPPPLAVPAGRRPHARCLARVPCHPFPGLSGSASPCKHHL